LVSAEPDVVLAPAAAVVVEMEEVDAVEPLADDESCSDVRNDRALEPKRSDGEPHGGGGGGPVRLEAL
jgi:hypothetical protein